MKLVGEVYDIFGLDFEMRLSTRPEGFLGEVDVWDKAEDALRSALDSTGRAWEVRRPPHSTQQRTLNLGFKLNLKLLVCFDTEEICMNLQVQAYELPLKPPSESISGFVV